MYSDNMIRLFYFCIIVCAAIDSGHGISSKMDFSEDVDATTFVANSTNADDEDVEVKHTIVVSTKLKNNNRRGLHSSGEGQKSMLPYNIGIKRRNEDSGEVPIVNGYKSVDTTQIRTPDTRFKAPNPQFAFINRNIRDEPDIYPNFVSIPSQWKPSTFYNNINWVNQDIGRPVYQRPGEFHRRITDDGMKEFYCRKCMQYDGQIYKGCGQQRSSPRYLYETTTPKMKIDGKLAKLN